MTTNLQLSITKTKKKTKNKNQLSKQLEQKQNHRNGDDREGYQWGGTEQGEKVQGIRSINDSYKVGGD